jgi:predicted enzyme related to lactoylglutathione lyase
VQIAGLGGVFLHSREPARLAGWYRDVLGIESVNYGESFHCELPVREAGGARRLTRAVWAVFPVGDGEVATAGVTVNYRVDDMDAVLAHVRARNVEIVRSEDGEYGRFAWLRDPDGNDVELWQDTGMED